MRILALPPATQPCFGSHIGKNKRLTPEQEDFIQHGHSVPPQFTTALLEHAGPGKPGLSIEPRTSRITPQMEYFRYLHQVIVYRNKDGKPVAAAETGHDYATDRPILLTLARDKSQDSTDKGDAVTGVIAIMAEVDKLGNWIVAEPSSKEVRRFLFTYWLAKGQSCQDRFYAGDMNHAGKYRTNWLIY